MKTAVSIPDDLYDEAEKLAQALRVSRSALYARALARLIDDANAQHVTAGLNAVYGTANDRDDFTDRIAADVLHDEGW